MGLSLTLRNTYSDPALFATKLHLFHRPFSPLPNATSLSPIIFQTPMSQATTTSATTTAATTKAKMCVSTMEMSPTSPMAAKTAERTFRVNFNTIEIQEYPIIAGDNPSVSTGVPLTIDWTPLGKNAYDFEEYEQAVEGVRRTCRAEIRIPASRRMEVLRQLGVSRGEIQDIVKEVNMARKQRQRTNELLGLAPAQFALERFSRAVKNVTVNRSLKKSEKTLLETCVSPIVNRTDSPSVLKKLKTIDDDESNTLTEASEMSLNIRSVA